MTNSQFNRTHQILLGLLIVQLGLVAWLYWPQPAASQTGGPLLTDFAQDEVTAINVSDSEGNAVLLTKANSGAWVLPENGDYPANNETVTNLLQQLEGVETSRLVTRTEGSHKRLQVADGAFNRKIELTLADGKTYTVWIGSSGGSSATHVRADDQAEVYLTGELTAWQINPQTSGWIEVEYFTLPPETITSLTVENENGTITFNKDSAETWLMAGLAADEVLNESAVQTLISQISSIHMTEPLGTESLPAYGLDNPQARVIVKTASESYTLQVGAQDADQNNSYVVSASTSPYIVQVAAFTGDNLINTTRADFLQTPPIDEPVTEE